MLYEVALVKKPTKKELEEGTGQEVLILSPTPVIANDPQGAAVQCVIANKAKIPEDLTRVEVLVRPFVAT